MEWVLKIILESRRAMSFLRVHAIAFVSAVTIAGVGVGVSSLIFALVDPYVLRSLPYADAERLVSIEVDASSATSAAPRFEEWQAKGHLFAGIAAFEYGPQIAVKTRDTVAWLKVARVTPNILEVLGAPVVEGALPGVALNANDSVLLTRQGERVIHSRVGDHLRSSGGRPLTVVGRTADEFVFPDVANGRSVDAMMSFIPEGVYRTDRAGDGRVGAIEPLRMIARLRSGVELQAVASELGTVSGGPTLGVRVEPLQRKMAGRVRPIAMGALLASCVLLAACIANVANILLAQTTHRLPDFAVRRALGASTHDLVRLLCGEAVVVVAAVAIVSVGCVMSAMALVARVIPPQFTALGEPGVTPRTVVFLVASSVLVVAVSFGPALAAACSGGRDLGRRMSARTTRRLRTARTMSSVVQGTLAMILAVAALTLVRSWSGLFLQESGYNNSVLSIPVSYGVVRPFGREVADGLEHLSQVPGVAAVSAARGSVVNDSAIRSTVTIRGERVTVDALDVTSSYFHVVGTVLVQGRFLAAGDENRKAIVIDKAMAEAYWPDGNALGSLVETGGAHAEVVGIVSNVLRRGLAAVPVPTVYRLMGPQRLPLLSVVYVVRLGPGGSPDTLQLRSVLAKVAPTAQIGIPDTIGDRLADTVRDKTFAALILGILGVSGVVVCMAGTSGVVNFAVVRRTKELAVMMALGAPASRIVRVVVAEALLAATIGSIAGLLIGRTLSESLQVVVYGIDAGSWGNAVAAGAGFVVLAVVAALVPARRVLSLRPSVALRAE